MRSLTSTLRNENNAAFVELAITTGLIPKPTRDDHVIIKVEAAPINPSDLGLLLAGGDVRTTRTVTNDGRSVSRLDVPQAWAVRMKARLDKAMQVGNEGCGTVVDAGPQAKSLLGKRVAVLGGMMYSQYRRASMQDCLVLLDGTTAADGASCFVNPLTVLGFLGTIKREGFKGLVHTAAASQLGQMLVRVCAADKIPLVNVVRREEQADLLRSMGATHIVNSSSPTFKADLTTAIAATSAYCAFDATGGGSLTSDLLQCMEEAANREDPKSYSIYGNETRKHVYIYGGLDPSATVLKRAFGQNWGVGGWLLTPYLKSITPAEVATMKARVAREVRTTFKTSYLAEVSLEGMLVPKNIQKYGVMATSGKYLVTPHKSIGGGASKL